MGVPPLRRSSPYRETPRKLDWSLRNADWTARCGGTDIDIGSRGHDFEGFRINRRPGRGRSGIVHGRRHEGDAGLDIDAGAEWPDIDIDVRERGHAGADIAIGAAEIGAFGEIGGEGGKRSGGRRGGP